MNHLRRNAGFLAANYSIGCLRARKSNRAGPGTSGDIAPAGIGNVEGQGAKLWNCIVTVICTATGSPFNIAG